MLEVFECVINQHDPLIVSLACMIWIVGSITFFLALGRAEECRSERRQAWLVMGACAAGLGVWATHFVAMLAYQGAMPIAYDLHITLVSAALSVLGFWIALQVLQGFSLSRCALAGCVVAVSVSAMHLVGMAAIRAQARIELDWLYYAQSTLTAFVLFTASFQVFARTSGIRRLVLSASGSIIAVCAIHFTGMAAATLRYDPSLPMVEPADSQTWLVGAVTASTILLVILTALATLIDRYLTDLRGFADATLEGIAIVRGNRIVEANQRFVDMMQSSTTDLLGQDPDGFLAAADGRPILHLREKPIEAVPRDMMDGSVYEVMIREVEYRGRLSQVLAVRDLTQAKAAQREIEHLARHDRLTGLANRTLLQERMDHALALSQRTLTPVALLALDLDRFKAVNDLFGHAQGDQVLQKVAAILRRCVRDSDTVARIGGDEFVILQVGSAQPEGARALTARLLAEFSREMDVTTDPMAVGVSIGVAIAPSDAVDAIKLHHAADVALYRAKTSGRGVAMFFDRHMDAAVRDRRQIEGDLRQAIHRQQLHLVYQPLVAVAGGRVTGYEALLRWTHPERGNVSPELFVPIAEESGSILAIGEWVLRRACQDAAAWDEPLSLAVNISATQFQAPNLQAIVISALDESGLAPSRLELEITETAMMKDRIRTVNTLKALKEHGIKVVMDDFGTGYSSLSNLQSFPFDKIKIDRSFVQAEHDDKAARSIIRAIVGIGKSLSLPVLAEGVETELQRQMVLQEGCAQAQGYLFGRPGAGPAPKVDALPCADMACRATA
ncbi:EAL domain-containing protein [Croceibacterium sp. TMG7-5b_MA50]|uniref:bifunctional diguanylate cyclase/phosphodiesterase n=1 Tax=Croceibacterium sp. TMG7-5b_MA50 TaxID=3121290 RepID=UPI003221F486